MPRLANRIGRRSGVPQRSRSTLASLAAAGMAALVVSCGSGQARGTVIGSGRIAGLGTILTNSAGLTLYAFPPDRRSHVSCTGSCALTWPPVTEAPGAEPRAGPGVDRSFLGTDADPAGGPRVVTYNGWPLYTYSDDVSPGQASGQGLDLSGGYWYVVSPAGRLVTAPA